MKIVGAEIKHPLLRKDFALNIALKGGGISLERVVSYFLDEDSTVETTLKNDPA